MMKRIICTLLVFVSAVILFACSANTVNNVTESLSEPEISDTLEPVSDVIETEESCEEMVCEPEQIPEAYEWVLSLCQKTKEVVFPSDGSEGSNIYVDYKKVFDGYLDQYSDVDLGNLYGCMKLAIWAYEVKDTFSYFLKDLDENGIPELFIISKRGFILMIFTISGGVPILLDSYWNRYSGYLFESNEIITYGSGGAAYSDYSILYLPYGGTKFEKKAEFGIKGEGNYYVLENGIERASSRQEVIYLYNKAEGFSHESIDLIKSLIEKRYN